MARVFKKVFHVISVFLDTLKTPNYSSKEMLIKSCKIRTGLHKHLFFFNWTDFAMERGHSACAPTSLNAVKIACKLVML